MLDNEKYSDKTTPNIPDYNDNLVFEPKMTWSDFVQNVKLLVDKNQNLSLDTDKTTDVYLYIRFNKNALVRFSSFGDISIMTYYNFEEDDTTIMENRTLEQMLDFIKLGI